MRSLAQYQTGLSLFTEHKQTLPGTFAKTTPRTPTSPYPTPCGTPKLATRRLCANTVPSAAGSHSPRSRSWPRPRPTWSPRLRPQVPSDSPNNGAFRARCVSLVHAHPAAPGLPSYPRPLGSRAGAAARSRRPGEIPIGRHASPAGARARPPAAPGPFKWAKLWRRRRRRRQESPKSPPGGRAPVYAGARPRQRGGAGQGPGTPGRGGARAGDFTAPLGPARSSGRTSDRGAGPPQGRGGRWPGAPWSPRPVAAALGTSTRGR